MKRASSHGPAGPAGAAAYRQRLRVLSLLSLLFGAACGDISLHEPDESPVEVGDRRVVELRFLRFDVTNFEQRITKEDFLGYPKDLRERLWLLDLELSGGPASPQLLDNALKGIRALDPATLGQAERNMQALLEMTPDNANLEGTALDELTALAPLLGLAPEAVMADLFDIGVEDTFLAEEMVSRAIRELVIETHPNQRTRLGPRTQDNPDGVYPVAPGSLAVTLEDVLTDFQSFAERFGPYDSGGEYHPGFISGEIHSQIVEDDFALQVRANANALPYKGLDLTNTHIASVASVGSQIDDLFDFNDPNWLQIEGLTEGEPTIESLTLQVVENDALVASGRSPVPPGIGSSEAWELPAWNLEHLLIWAGQKSYADLDSNVAYYSPGHDDPIFQAQVVKGFQSFQVRGGLGSPPPPSYVWDVLLDVAQVRLHDGGLKEGEADVAITLHDLPLGTDTATLQERIRENLREQPDLLGAVANEVLDNTEGAADFYYYRASPQAPDAQQGDWLFFVTEADIAVDEEGDPVRAYGYDSPGFFKDQALTEKVSTPEALDGDTAHEKVKIEQGDVLYVADDAGAVFELRVGYKPSPNRVRLWLERMR